MARILTIYGKCSDLCCTEYKVNGKTIKETDGYAPSIPGICSGDDIQFDLDLDTGKVISFKPITHEEVLEALGDDNDEDEDDEIDREGEGRYQDENGNWVGPTTKELDSSINKMLGEINF
jgi:hypothetical protein